MNTIIQKIFLKLGYNVEKLKPVIKDEVWDGKLTVKERFVPYTCTFLSKTLHVHDFRAFLLGNEELFKEEIYKFSASTDRPYIIDCGANMGMSIIYFKYLYPLAEVVAFEADSKIYSFLEKNIISFGLSNVTAINKAVWDKEGDTLSFLSEGGAGGRLEKDAGNNKLVEVKTSRLRNLLQRKVDFLKIDIEGAEYNVIKDCAEELKNVETLFVEYHSFPEIRQNLHDILSIVQNAGFKYHIKSAFVWKYPFIERQTNFGMDLQLNIFCYRH